MIILDTNVISEFIRARPEPRVVVWLDRHDTADLWLTAIAVAELQAGVAKLEAGDRRQQLARAIEITLDEFEDRILPFGADAAYVFGNLTGPLLASGTRFPIMDYQIAAITLLHGGVLATRNTKDFSNTGVSLVNPWDF